MNKTTFSLRYKYNQSLYVGLPPGLGGSLDPLGPQEFWDNFRDVAEESAAKYTSYGSARVVKEKLEKVNPDVYKGLLQIVMTVTTTVVIE